MQRVFAGLLGVLVFATVAFAGTPPDIRFHNAVGDNTGRISGATVGAAAHTDNGVFNNIDVLTITAPDNVLGGTKVLDNTVTPQKLQRGAVAPAAGLTYWGDGTWGAPNQSELAQFRNLKMTTTGALDNQSILVTADKIVMTSDTNDPVIRSSVSFTIDLGNSGAGGLDNGSLAANVGYFIFAIDNGTVAGLASTSATSPVLPATYTRKGLLGWVTTDNTTDPFNIKEFTQTDDAYMWLAKPKLVDNFASTSATAINLAAGGALTYAVVPPNITKSVFGKVLGNTQDLYWTLNNQTYADSIALDNDVVAVSITLPAGKGNVWRLDVLTESQTIYHQNSTTAGAASTDVWLNGFILKR